MKTPEKHASRKFAVLAIGAAVSFVLAAPAAYAGAVAGGAVRAANDGALDIANAIPMPLPQSQVAPVDDGGEMFSASLGAPGSVPGAVGNGKQTPVIVPVGDESAETGDDGISSQEFGTSNHPFTTKRVDTAGAGTNNTAPNGVSLRYPYRATGKLYFKDGTSTFVCSASLIKRGIVVTAAHCVARFGQNRFYTNFQFHPARYDALSPYGVWSVNGRWAMTSYLNGTDTCSTPGIVCRNDIAVLRIAPKTTAPTLPGTATGWYGYGWNGYGFTPNNLALFNQLGYPAALDGGLRMQRTDSQAFVSSSLAGNSVWGGLQTGGSSGGPELVNLGISPVLSGGILHGAEWEDNRVVGVTSWGYTNQAIKQQGASPFLSTNIVPLVAAACAGSPTPAQCL
jgi:hypothetical protein